MTPLDGVEVLGSTLADPDRLGGKAAALSRLIEEGFRIPAGFVVTTDAFRETVAHLGLELALAEVKVRLDKSESVDGSEMRRGLREGRLPPVLANRISMQAASLGLGRRGLKLIARSSATVEDGRSFSFAGIFESVPVTHPEKLESAILEVWESLFAPRALAYIKESGIGFLPRMAVVLQRFIEATRSGVMFTEFAAPDGRPSVLIEHVEGGCEKLVKGEVTPDRAWFPRFDGSGGPIGRIGKHHAATLLQQAERLEGLFGGPQDVEWVAADEELYIVQSRPITRISAPSPPARLLPASELGAPLLSGVPASKGTASGEVHIAFNIEQAEQVQGGQVLVTPMTNPDMVVAMRRSAAVVTDVGGIICHAAIVSRELGLPCVVGTEQATSLLTEGQDVTVDGWSGVVYDGLFELDEASHLRRLEWSDLWDQWQTWADAHKRPVPLVPSLGALEAVPEGLVDVALVPDVDLRCDEQGLWRDLETFDRAARESVFDDYVRSVVAAADLRRVQHIAIVPLDPTLGDEIGSAIERIGAQGRIAWGPSQGATSLVGAVAKGKSESKSKARGPRDPLDGPADTLRFFGHTPRVHLDSMPQVEARRRWWFHLPEYGRFHRQFGTERDLGAYEWLEVRPEIVISALLKSLVQPGFEMVPRVLGFNNLPPMHTKWMRCRYHFRADVFAGVWDAIVRATWSSSTLMDLLRRVRASYRSLDGVLSLFPQTEEELRSISNERAVAVIASWWPRWVEFFALCWFLQAQGDDVLCPFIEETLTDNLSRLQIPHGGGQWPALDELIAPTTPVMSAQYVTDLAELGVELRAAGFHESMNADSLVEQVNPQIAARVSAHLASWHWMRDRDLLFEPWDSEHVVIGKALGTAPPTPVRYEENRRRNLLALAFHADLARDSGRAEAFTMAARFLHDLNVERENHHVLWLKYSYPLRQLVVELGRRISAVSELAPAEVFFLQAPELLDIATSLPQAPPDDLVVRVKNRRAGYLREAKLSESFAAEPVTEDDYY